MAMMREVQVARAGGPLELVEREIPEPAQGEVRDAFGGASGQLRASSPRRSSAT